MGKTILSLACALVARLAGAQPAPASGIPERWPFPVEGKATLPAPSVWRLASHADFQTLEAASSTDASLRLYGTLVERDPDSPLIAYREARVLAYSPGAEGVVSRVLARATALAASHPGALEARVVRATLRLFLLPWDAAGNPTVAGRYTDIAAPLVAEIAALEAATSGLAPRDREALLGELLGLTPRLDAALDHARLRGIVWPFRAAFAALRVAGSTFRRLLPSAPRSGDDEDLRAISAEVTSLLRAEGDGRLPGVAASDPGE